MKIGYARVSTDDQNMSLQLDALAAAGCEKVFQDEFQARPRNAPASMPPLPHCSRATC